MATNSFMQLAVLKQNIFFVSLGYHQLAIFFCCAHLIQQEKNATWSNSSQQPFLFLERLDATGTRETQGGLLIYTPALGRAMCPPGISQSACTLICMHPLRRGWRQIRASSCSVALFTETEMVYWRPEPSFRHWLPTVFYSMCPVMICDSVNLVFY